MTYQLASVYPRPRAFSLHHAGQHPAPTGQCRAFPPQWAKTAPGQPLQHGRSCSVSWVGFKPGLHPLNSVAWGESQNCEQHLSASLQNGRIIQAHDPRRSATKLGTQTHWAANVTGAEIPCTIFTLHNFQSCLGWCCPRCHEGQNIRYLSLKLQTSEFQNTAGPRVSSKGPWFCPYCTTDLWKLNVTIPEGCSI